MLSRLALRSVSENVPYSSIIIRQSTSTSGAPDYPLIYDGHYRPRAPVYPGKVRMGFIPEEWFQNFYPKTGVTGPYAFGFTSLTFLLSKEWIVCDHELNIGIVLAAIAIFGIKRFGPTVAKALDELVDARCKELDDLRDNAIEALKSTIENEKNVQWKAQGQSMLFDAKKENIGLQLEAAYRERLAEFHSMVKKKLDYQLETSNVKLKFEQRHMASWIVDNVRKSITPALEAATMKQCLTDLKALAAKA